MTDCMVLLDRMPDVARARASWTTDESRHLAECAECAAAWAVVASGVQLGGAVTIDAERVASRVLGRLREEPANVPVRRIPWRGSMIGLLAAAATVAIIIGGPQLARHRGNVDADTMSAVAILPGLQQMDDGQLGAVLESIDQPAPDAAGLSIAPRLEDLTEAQLQELLKAMGGE